MLYITDTFQLCQETSLGFIHGKVYAPKMFSLFASGCFVSLAGLKEVCGLKEWTCWEACPPGMMWPLAP